MTDRFLEIIQTRKSELEQEIIKTEKEILEARNSFAEFLYINDKNPNIAHEEKEPTPKIGTLYHDIAFYKSIINELNILLERGMITN